jgi:glycosyltransferase involved in cell wall biosynthesis
MPALRPDRPAQTFSPEATAPDASLLPIAVVIPAYNRAHLLDEALDSVFGQSPNRPAEIIIVDDNSDDETAAVARARGVTVVGHDVNRGPAAARNTGMKATTQPWVAFLDADDDWLPNHLQTLWDARDGHLLVAGSCIAWSPENVAPTRVLGPLTRRPRRLASAAPLFFPENPIVQSGVLVRRDIALDVGGYPEDWRHSEDLYLWVRLLERGTGVVLPDVTLRYRAHSQQTSRAKDKMRESRAAVVAARIGEADPGRRSKSMVVTHWDHLRDAERLGRRREALAGGLWFLTPQRLVALSELLIWRYRGRRGAYRFDRQGRPSVALIAGDKQILDTLAGLRVFDLRAMTTLQKLVALLSCPPGKAITAKAWHRHLLRWLGVAEVDVTT